jgi:hypothetical protein
MSLEELISRYPTLYHMASRVFFWVKEERLRRLLTAAEYVDFEHDVLTVDTASLLSAMSRISRATSCRCGE